MRLRTDIWVAALIRRVNAAGDFAAVERKGAAEAGAIFLKIEPRNRSCQLYGPAPSLLLAEKPTQGRLFVAVRPDEIIDPISAQTYLDKETRFDSDLWIVTIESDAGEQFFDIAVVD
ncbi:MAG: DUF1491 family protein [Pseudomonadota bacterium]